MEPAVPERNVLDYRGATRGGRESPRRGRPSAMAWWAVPVGVLAAPSLFFLTVLAAMLAGPGLSDLAGRIVVFTWAIGGAVFCAAALVRVVRSRGGMRGRRPATFGVAAALTWPVLLASLELYGDSYGGLNVLSVAVWAVPCWLVAAAAVAAFGPRDLFGGE